MTRMSHRILAAATALTVLSTGASALAAEAAPIAEAPVSTIAVQLDGQALTFTDAVPQVKEERTFLPFRAVFEAMGAEVSYDAETNQVSATRDGTTVTMTLGSTEAAVTTGDVTTTLTMDVAPYAAENRTYVPVRFAAQAFGCAVGWDQDDSTVILVDTQKLLQDAKADRTFTYLDKYLAYNEQFMTGNWEMKADFDASATVLGMGPATLEGTMSGITAGSTQMEAAMTMKMDLKALLNGFNGLVSAGTEAEGAVDAEAQAKTDALLKALKEDGISMELRGDMGTGLLYFTLSGDALTDAGIPADTWISMDLGALYGAMGMDYTALLDASKTLDPSALLQTALSGMALTDKDADYAAVSALVDGVAKFLSDESFVKDGANYTTTYTLEQDGAATVITFTLLMKDDAVVGYDLTMKVTAGDDEAGIPAMSMDMKAGMDADNNMTVTMTVDSNNMFDLSLEMTGSYAATDKAPELAPPAGATVIPYEQLLGAAGDTAAEVAA